MEHMTLALSIVALVVSILTFALSFRAARLAERRGRMPVLVFEWQSNGWGPEQRRERSGPKRHRRSREGRPSSQGHPASAGNPRALVQPCSTAATGQRRPIPAFVDR